MASDRQLQRYLQHQAQASAHRLIEAGTTVVIAYGGGPANQYGLASSGNAITRELTARGVPAVQIAANSPQGFDQLVHLDPARVRVWVTDPYRHSTSANGEVVRSDLRYDLQPYALPVVSQSTACSTATLFKDQTIAVAGAVGLRTIPGVLVTQGNHQIDQALHLIASNGAVITKPVDGDEGQGVSLATSPAQMLAAIAAIHHHRSDALVEVYTPGTEVGVPVLVLGPANIVALPAVEASADGALIDHRVKPHQERCSCTAPHDTSPARSSTSSPTTPSTWPHASTPERCCEPISSSTTREQRGFSKPTASPASALPVW